MRAKGRLEYFALGGRKGSYCTLSKDRETCAVFTPILRTAVRWGIYRKVPGKKWRINPPCRRRASLELKSVKNPVEQWTVIAQSVLPQSRRLGSSSSPIPDAHSFPPLRLAPCTLCPSRFSPFLLTSHVSPFTSNIPFPLRPSPSIHPPPFTHFPLLLTSKH